MSGDMQREIATAAAKVAPPVAVSASAAVSGWTLNEWVLIITLIYLLLQIGALFWKWAGVKGRSLVGDHAVRGLRRLWFLWPFHRKAPPE
jgi:uncharacterized membrane protein